MNPTRRNHNLINEQSKQFGHPLYPKLADSELVRRALDGDLRSFDELMNRYSGMVYSFLVAKIGDRHSAEDLLQEVFVGAFSGLKGLRNLNSFGPFVMRIARNKIYDFVQGEQRRKNQLGHAEDIHYERIGYEISDKTIGVSDKASELEIADMVVEELYAMKDAYQVILYPYLFEERSAGELGRQLALKESTVRMRLMRGLKKLRVGLERKGIRYGELWR